ncbi:MAG TPA: CBS and ACT domain-containing protein [Clostridiales bacterium]|nr:CBS and ACT domain-containing protein [Clostridiales bacterium]
MNVKSRMTSNPYTISPEATIAEALELMRSNNVRRLPVVRNGKLVGIVTEREIQEVSPSKATTLSIFELNYLLSKTKVSAVMTKEVITISPDALLEEAAVLMRDNRVGALPVIQDGKVVGIITETNIFDAFIDLLGFRESGTRICVEVEDSPGILADVARVIKGFGANITHLVVYRSNTGKSDIIIRVNTTNTDEMIQSLEKQGYKVTSVSKNY